DRLAARQLAQAGQELHHLHRGGERRVARRRKAVHAHRDAARSRDLGVDLGPRQQPALARLGALGELELDHLHLRIGGVGDEALLVEAAPLVAAAEVARADLPYQVAAMLAVVARDRALAGVV